MSCGGQVAGDDDIGDEPGNHAPLGDPADETSMDSSRRVRLTAIGAAAVAAVLTISVTAAALSGSADDPVDDLSQAEEHRGVAPQSSSTTTARPTTTSTSVAAPSTTTTELVNSPASASPAGTPSSDLPAPSPSPSTSPPPPPPPAPEPPPATADPRARADGSSSNCGLQADGTILATGRVQWSDGFVDTASTVYSTPGPHVLVTTSRHWSFSVYVSAPPDGAIGDLSCWIGGGSGPVYWP